MIAWVFSVLTILAVAVAAFVNDVRRATLALWIAGLGVGCIFLTLGAEVLAILQWIVSTLVAISFVFFAVMFGEYGKQHQLMDRRRAVALALCGVIGAAFAGVVWLGGAPLPGELLAVPTSGNDMQAVGRTLTDNHLLSLEILALTLFLVLIGGGVVARPEKEGASA